ncbi:MAG: organomercurial lyase [Acidobacteriota bacterium]
MAVEREVRLAVYRHFTDCAAAPTVAETARRTGLPDRQVRTAYGALAEQRILVLEEDGETLRMAPPFSAVATPHVATIDGRSYFANCAWDVFGVVAALGGEGVVESRCEHSGTALRLELRGNGPEASPWRFHSLLPASQWWRDIVFT